MSRSTSGKLSSKLRLFALVAVAVVFVVFAISNAAKVEVNLLFAQVTMPRFLMLGSCFSLGVLAGWLIRPWRKQRNPPS